MIALNGHGSATGEIITWVILGLIFFGGSIAAFGRHTKDVLLAFANRGGKKSSQRLSGPERAELGRLREENDELRRTLLEVQAWDKFAVSPLPTELSMHVAGAVARKEIQP